jgi:hypothetical protein
VITSATNFESVSQGEGVEIKKNLQKVIPEMKLSLPMSLLFKIGALLMV